MNYIEKVLNDRIEELKKKNQETLNELKQKLNNNTLNDAFDIEDCFLSIDEKETRINELEILKKGLGLVPIEELKDGEN